MKEEKIKKWEELSRELAFQKYNRKIEKIMYRLQDGTESDYYIGISNHVVCILALTKNAEVILAKQYRPGPNEILHELPGGGAEKDEDIEKAAARELLEETGYAGTITAVTRCYDDAYSTLNRHCFVATDCEKVAEPQPDPTEFIEVVLKSLPEFRELLRSGRLTDVEVGYLGLDFLNLL